MKDQKLTYTAIALYAAACAVLFGALMAISYAPPAQNGAMLGNWIIGTLGMVLGNIVTMLTPRGSLPPEPPAVVTPPAIPQVAKSQIGFAGWPLLLVLALASLAMAVSGCASLTQAGNTAYSLKPVLGSDGKATSCEFSAQDGKEFSSRSMAVTVGAEGCQAMVQEGASSAFQGQAIAGKALSVLPSFAPLVLPPGPAGKP